MRPLAIATDENANDQARADAIAALVRIKPGDAGRGRVVYQRVCATCHIVGRWGRTLGPTSTMWERA